MTLSVSATTRAPRAGEIDGEDYFFLSDDEFSRRQQAGDFLECKEVFGLGHWYGTLREQVATGLKAGQVGYFGDRRPGCFGGSRAEEFNPITLFIHPGGMEELEERLRARGTESEEAIAARLETAASEMRYMHRYQYEIINESVDNGRRRNLSNIERPKGKTSMLEELKEEEIVNKVGGRFKLSTLIQKRLVQLNQGSRALVNVDTHDKMSIVLQEIMQDKIVLNMDNEVEQMPDLDATIAAAEGPELDASDL